MAERDTSRDIDQAASGWTARLDRGPLTPEEDEAFQAWLGGDPRRRGALLRAQALSMMSESAQALGPDFDPAAFEPPRRAPPARPSRRQALGWATAAAAAAVVAILGVGRPAGAVTRTERGEIRLVPLKDGSTVLLNTKSAIRVKYDEGERFVTLLEGEAYFSVARDDRRPFVVEVGGRRLRTAQAGFRVRKLDSDPVDVLVQQGLVDLDIPNLAAPSQVVVLEANTRMALPDLIGGRPERPRLITPETVTRELAWREGKLAFEGETLQAAADAFGRYSDTRIRIRDPNLAREPVTGLFAANDPVGFSRAIAHVFDARLEQDGDNVVLTRAGAAH